jgi:hypothetical protein
MESYEDLRALIKRQIDEGMILSDRSSATPGDKIIAWIEVSRKCLIHIEDRVPTLRRDFDVLKFHFRIPEEDVMSEVLEVGDAMRLLENVDEKLWSESWSRDGGEHPIDFNFRDLQYAVELLKLADEKLRLDSAPQVPHDLRPKWPAERLSAGEMKLELAASPTALPSGASGGDIGPDGNGYEAGPEPLNRFDWVDEFLRRCTQETKLKATRKHIWQVALHGSPRQFQYWQASSPKATKQDDLNFRRILEMKPTDFETLLKKKGII